MTKEEKLNNEILRIDNMAAFQRSLSGETKYVFGIDEAGRGPLCGPVVAGCCILPEDCRILYLNDSKKLSEQKREALYDEIVSNAYAWGIGIASAERIDEINILNATYEAMAEAFENCLNMYKDRVLTLNESNGFLRDSMDCIDGFPSVTDSIVLVDGNKTVPGIAYDQLCVIGGDAKCPSVSAASILAKVTRDRMMKELDNIYPEYGFASNKGYGTKQHYQAIRQYGILDIHRRSFLRNI